MDTGGQQYQLNPSDNDDDDEDDENLYNWVVKYDNKWNQTRDLRFTVSNWYILVLEIYLNYFLISL